MKFEPARSYDGGIFQWTLGQSYKTSLGGSFSTSLGQTSAVSVAADSKFMLGTTNSVKYAWETSVSFGKSFSYKDVDEIEFKPSGISIAEYSGARCTELFQASAGLGPIQRGQFEAQRSAARTAMKILVICNGASAIANILMSGFGQGFAEQGKNNVASKNALEVGIAVTAAQALLAIIPVVMVLAHKFLNDAKKLTKPKEWQPKSTFQASATKGIFIGAAPATLASMLRMDAKGTHLTVFGAPIPTLIAEDIGLLENVNQHIVEYDLATATKKSTMQMTDNRLFFETEIIDLEGLTGPGRKSMKRTGTALQARFETIKLAARNDVKEYATAFLNLDTSASPKASLIAGGDLDAPAISSVVATQTDLTLKSGASTELVLNSTSLNMKAHALKLEAVGAVEINCTQFKVNGASGFSVLSALIRLG